MTTLKLAPVFQKLLTRITDRSIPVNDAVEASCLGVSRAYREVGNRTNGLITDIILGGDMYNDLTQNDLWSRAFDPKAKDGADTVGLLGRMFGAQVWTTHVLDKEHPQGQLLRSLPGLIFLTADGTFFFYETSVVPSVFKQLRTLQENFKVVAYTIDSFSADSVKKARAYLVEHGNQPVTDILIHPDLLTDVLADRQWTELMQLVNNEQEPANIGRVFGAQVWTLAFVRRSNPVFVDLMMPGVVMLTADGKAHHFNLKVMEAPRTVTPGEHAYHAYNHGTAAQQSERSTTAPLPFNHLNAVERARWEEVATTVRQDLTGLGSAASAAINFLAHLRDHGGLNPADQVEAVRVITRLQHP